MSGQGEEQIIKSNCRGCHGGCGVLVHVKEGRITKIEGDPDFPTNRGSLCSKGLAFQQLMPEVYAYSNNTATVALPVQVGLPIGKKAVVIKAERATTATTGLLGGIVE